MRVVIAWLCLFAAQFSGAEPMEGVDYAVVGRRASPAAGPIEVIEFFYYGCGACARFEPVFEAWRRGVDADVQVRRIPVAHDAPRWFALARLYFVLEQLDLVDVLHGDVFRAIYHRNRDLSSRSEQLAWAKDAGIGASQFERALDSAALDAGIQAARESSARFHVHSTPSLVIDGQYLTSGAITGDLNSLIPVVDGLIDKVRRERSESK